MLQLRYPELPCAAAHAPNPRPRRQGLLLVRLLLKRLSASAGVRVDSSTGFFLVAALKAPLLLCSQPKPVLLPQWSASVNKVQHTLSHVACQQAKTFNS